MRHPPAPQAPPTRTPPESEPGISRRAATAVAGAGAGFARPENPSATRRLTGRHRATLDVNARAGSTTNGQHNPGKRTAGARDHSTLQSSADARKRGALVLQIRADFQHPIACWLHAMPNQRRQQFCRQKSGARTQLQNHAIWAGLEHRRAGAREAAGKKGRDLRGGDEITLGSELYRARTVVAESGLVKRTISM